MPGTNADVRGLGGFVWSIAEILRGDFKQSEYGKIILPFIVLRRLDCLLEASKRDVLEAAKGLSDAVDDPTRDMILFGAAGENTKVYNLSAFTFDSLKAQDPGQLHDNLIDYITKFSGNVRDIFLDKFLFTEQLKRLNEGGILWQVFDRFTQIDLHPERVSQHRNGLSVRGSDPAIFGDLERDGGRTFHAARSHPPHRRTAHRQRRHQADGEGHHPAGL